MRKLFILCLSALVVLGFAAAALAGPGSVVIKTDGDITLTVGGVVLVEPTWEMNNDFDKRNYVRNTMTNATFATPAVGFTTRAIPANTNISGKTTGLEQHDPYGWGSISNNALVSSVDMYFNFNKKDIWDVFIDLNAQGNWDNRVADGTFAGVRWLTIRQLAATYKLAPLASRFYYGWAAWAPDDTTGMVYANNDPSFAVYGASQGVSWDMRYTKRIEGNSAGLGTQGGTITARDADANIWSLKLDYNVTKDYKIGMFYAYFDAKSANGTGNLGALNANSANIGLNYLGIQARGTIAGAWKPALEIVYEWGQKENSFDSNAQNINTTGSNVGAFSSPEFAPIVYPGTSPGGTMWGAGTPNLSNPQVRAWMIYAGLDANLTKLLGAPWNLTPYVKYLWTQGDKNMGDTKDKAFKSIVGGSGVRIGNKANILAMQNNVIGTNAISMNPNEMSSATGGFGNVPWGGLSYFAFGATANPVKELSTLLNIYYAKYNVAPTYGYTDAFGVAQTVSAFGTDNSGNPNAAITATSIGWGFDFTNNYKLDKNVTVGLLYGVLFPGANIKNRVENQGTLTDHGSRTSAHRLIGQMVWSF